MSKSALISGITGQDGSYLAAYLLKKGYEVHGIVRRNSSLTRERLDDLFSLDKIDQDAHRPILHYGDLIDSSNLNRIMERVRPDEIYNLAAQSHVQISFDVPEYTADVDAIGTLRLLECIRETQLHARFYQASTSELYGDTVEVPQNEGTQFRPRSPYAIAKLYAYWTVVNYREAYGLHASNGILFNHESPRRGENFVTRKITLAACRIKAGQQEVLRLGNLNAVRDWGYAPDFVEGMWLMLQQSEPGDYVLATGQARTVREFVKAAFDELDISIEWRGEGVNEQGIDARSGKPIVLVDRKFFRPTEVNSLIGDSRLAARELGWKPSIGFDELVNLMVKADWERVKRK